jgi:hypothetical protein
MDEEWRPVVGYEDLYSVSNLGRVRRDAPARGAVVGRILRPATRKDGRRSVALWKNCVTETRLVYSLVAEAFVGPCPEGQEINHKNGDCSDDRSANLEYVTHDEERAPRRRDGDSLTQDPVAQRQWKSTVATPLAKTIANIARSYGVAEPTDPAPYQMPTTVAPVDAALKLAK